MKTLPSPAALRRLPLGLADLAVILGTLTLLATIAQIGAGSFVSFQPPNILPVVDLDPRHLPYYAARSTLRMFIALFCSTIFTLAYGYIAARYRRAEKIMIPLLDILQSIPVLTFLAFTTTYFIALFPGSLLGLEAASIFAIFTGQAWNMTFSFYQSLKTVPRELDEAVTLYRLSAWQRFTKLEVPSAAIGLVWNGMMSFGGGWFFVVASEAISVLNQNYTLPGVGSYVAAAITAKNLPDLGWATLAIAVTIWLVDQLFWRPLVAWADKFRVEQSSSATAPESWVYDLFTTARIPRLVGQLLRPVGDKIDRVLSDLTPAKSFRAVDPDKQVGSDRLYNIALLFIVGGCIAAIADFIITTVGFNEVIKVLGLGLLTMARVIVMLIFATLAWTPIGVTIGLSPKLTRFLQPVVQFLASFPANLIFPFATIFFIRYHISLNWGSIVLMTLGSQWYILFNSIAGAQSIPTDLREMADDIGLRGWKRWQNLIVPGIFSAWVTGGVTACGGAWNASIVSEIVTWGATTLTATGLGAYIAQATTVGDWSRISLGSATISLFVVGFNRLLWRRMYKLAETKYHF
jgi:NitT/TauT family transport system permease protein